MSKQLPSEESFFETLAAVTGEAATGKAPSSVKSRLYSALVTAQERAEGLRSLPEIKSAGRQLCVFEELVCIAPVGEANKAVNYCRRCHARVLAESFDDVPIQWAGCPYVGFQNS